MGASLNPVNSESTVHRVQNNHREEAERRALVLEAAQARAPPSSPPLTNVRACGRDTVDAAGEIPYSTPTCDCTIGSATGIVLRVSARGPGCAQRRRSPRSPFPANAAGPIREGRLMNNYLALARKDPALSAAAIVATIGAADDLRVFLLPVCDAAVRRARSALSSATPITCQCSARRAALAWRRARRLEQGA